jgi:hypothetical protein
MWERNVLNRKPEGMLRYTWEGIQDEREWTRFMWLNTGGSGKLL